MRGCPVSHVLQILVFQWQQHFRSITLLTFAVPRSLCGTLKIYIVVYVLPWEILMNEDYN